MDGQDYVFFKIVQHYKVPSPTLTGLHATPIKTTCMSSLCTRMLPGDRKIILPVLAGTTLILTPVLSDMEHHIMVCAWHQL